MALCFDYLNFIIRNICLLCISEFKKENNFLVFGMSDSRDMLCRVCIKKFYYINFWNFVETQPIV